MNWLKTANVIVLVIFTSYFGYSLIVPIYVKNTWEGEYKELMYGCDHAMKEHYIAKKANVPIYSVALDFENKQIKVFNPFIITGNIDNDITHLRSLYKGVKGKIPEYS